MARTNMNRPGDCGQRTKELVARYYLSLLGEFRRDCERLFLSMNEEDMFHNAIILILQDSYFRRLKTDEEIMANIRRRIGNVITEVKKDAVELNKLMQAQDADHLQAEEE